MATSVLFIAVCFLAYANGANDNFKSVAILFGSDTANYRPALSWATLTTLAGSICALFPAVHYRFPVSATHALLGAMPGNTLSAILSNTCFGRRGFDTGQARA